jgi:hypothetical protein
VRNRVGCQFDGKQHAMDNLPIWALWPITVAVGISPGLAILSARPIARLLHRALWPRPETAPLSGRDLARDEPARAATPPG